MTYEEQRRIEQALVKLRGVEAARVYMSEGEIAEIHVAADSRARPKNIARDVRTYLAAALGIEVSHQKISVAVCEGGEPAATSEAGAGAEIETGEAGSDEPEAPRLGFRSVNLLIEGLQLQAQVELLLGERQLLGTASGVPADGTTQRVIVDATLRAVSEIVRGDVRLLSGGVAVARVGGSRTVLTEILIVGPRSEERLIGASAAGSDRNRSVVFATLDALNRILPRLMPEHWIEYHVDSELSEPGSETPAPLREE